MWRAVIVAFALATIASSARATTTRYIPGSFSPPLTWDASLDELYIDRDGDGQHDYGVDLFLSNYIDEVTDVPGTISNGIGASASEIIRLFRDASAVTPPTNVTRRLNQIYFSAEMDSVNHGNAWPIKASGEACPNGGTYPNCTTAKNHLSADRTFVWKAAEGELGGRELTATCPGPGDCIADAVNVYSIGPSPAASDEATTGYRAWLFDTPADLMTGTLSGVLTHSATDLSVSSSITLGAHGAEGLAYMGRNGLIVFNDAGLAQRVRLTGAAGAGGLLDYDNTTGTWQVRTASQLPSGLGNADGDVDHTGYCFAADKAQRTTAQGSTTIENWLLITHGPGDAGCGGVCAADEFETYSPYLGQDRHAPEEYVPGANWPEFATGAADDDATIAPCELIESVEYQISTTTGKPVTAATYPLHFAATTTRSASIASGTDWEYAALGPPGQVYGVKVLFDTQQCSGQTCVPIYGRVDSSTLDDTGTIDAVYIAQIDVADATSDVSLERPVARSGFHVRGPAVEAGFQYQPWSGSGANFPETPATLLTELADGDYGTANADAVKVLELRNQSNNQTLRLIGDTSADLWKVSADGGTARAVAQVIASGSSALGTGAINSGTCASAVTAAASGTATTDVVDWSFNADTSAVTGYGPATSPPLYILAYPTANNVNFKVCNPTTGSVTPGAATVNWQVVR